MKLLEKILVPIDINTTPDSVVKEVKFIAKKYDSDVLLLCTLPREYRNKSFTETISQVAKEKLTDIKKKLKGVNVSLMEVEFANPLENIIKYSRTENVNLILISPKTHSEDEEDAISHLVEKLARKSEKPVWILKGNKKTEIKKILCPVDFSNASERALKNAIQLTRKFESLLSILNAYSPIDTVSEWFEVDVESENKQVKEQHDKDMKVFLDKFNLVDVNHTIDVIPGNTNQVISDMVVKKKIDLVIIGTTGNNNFGKILMGGVTEKLIRELPCSVITTKSTDIINLRLENETRDIEMLSKIAQQLTENGFYKEAIEQYELCLRINDMHIPSHYRIAKVYQKLGNEEKALVYQNTATELMDRIWDKKIEYEVRKHYFNK